MELSVNGLKETILKSVLVPAELVARKLVDENFKDIGKDYLKGEVHKGIEKFTLSVVDVAIDKYYDKLLGGIHGKLIAIVDKIDGQIQGDKSGNVAEIQAAPEAIHPA